MIADMRTIIWKELRNMFRHQNRSRIFITLLSPLAFSIIFPLQAGRYFLSEIPALILAVFMPVILLIVIVPDAFAGERERHTLETLLASRLPDDAIFFGKIITALLLSWLTAITVSVISLTTVNIAFWEGEILFFKCTLLWANILLGILMPLLVSALGVLISLRVETAQQASQMLSSFFVLPPAILMTVMFVLPEDLRNAIIHLDGQMLLIIISAILAVGSAVLLWLARRRFQRDQLALLD